MIAIKIQFTDLLYIYHRIDMQKISLVARVSSLSFRNFLSSGRQAGNTFHHFFFILLSKYFIKLLVHPSLAHDRFFFLLELAQMTSMEVKSGRWEVHYMI